MFEILFIIFILLFVLGGIGAIVGIVYGIKALSKPSPILSKENKEREAISSLQKVMAQRGELALWGSHGPGSISNVFTFQYTEFFDLDIAGKIESTEGQPIIAFDRSSAMMGGSTTMVAASTDFFLLFDRSNGVVEIRFNEEILGRIDYTGNVFDPSGQCIAHARRPQSSGFTNHTSGHTMGAVSYKLLMNNRELATVYVPPDRAMSVFSGPAPGEGRAVLRILDTPSPEEEKWLIAIAIWEVAFQGFSRPSLYRNHRRHLGHLGHLGHHF